MDLSLRLVASHPRADGRGAGGGPGRSTEFALSTRRPALLLGQDSLLLEQSTATMGVRASVRTSASVERLVYCGGCGAYLAFLDDNSVAVYAELPEGGVALADTRTIPGDDRSVSMAAGSQNRSFAVFAKADSPSVYCVFVKGTPDDPRIADISKLLADRQGAQENVGALGQGLAKLRGTIVTSTKSKPSPLVVVATHPSRNLAGAAFANGFIRVWDVDRKELRSQFDAQLLLREEIVNIAFHPDLNVLCACTSHGRVMAFQIRGVPIAKSEEPQLATCKLRDRTRRYRAMCFLHGSPTYLLLLTSTRKIVTRVINQRGQIVPSQRFPKASRSIPTVLDGVGPSFAPGAELDPSQQIVLACEPTFGLIASTLDNSGGVLVYQQFSDRVSTVRRPVIGAPIQTGFSNVVGKAFTGPVNMFSDIMFAQDGKVYSVTLDGSEITHLCNLPRNTEIRRIEVARDQFGSLFAALVFLFLESDAEPNAMLTESEESPNQYVLITRRGNGESWNVSETMEGSTGCFLNPPCRHDRILVLSPDGTMASVRSFAGQRLSRGEQRSGQVASRQSRGVQRFSVGQGVASQVFRAPFSSWCAVVFEDSSSRILSVSKNTFRKTEPLSGQDNRGKMSDDTFEMDTSSIMPLRGSEKAIDVRWQRLPTGSRGEQYLAAILTTERLYIVRDVFEPIARFDFHTLDRSVLPFVVPTMSWLGPAVIIMFGQYLYAITLDGRSDFIAGMSYGENACVLSGVLPDRILYVRPSGNKEFPATVVCRPIGFVSVLVRGMLALPSARKNDGSYYMAKLRDIMLSHDASQGSEALVDALILNNLAPVAYILIRSENGQHSLPPLKRATCLGRIGDFRGALKVAETEYARLPSADSFHSGSELFRLLQRILNLAMAAGDFAVGRRCSELLGRRGTFTSFVDCEGGYAALTAVCQYANETGNRGVAQALGTLVERSSKSCIAMDSSHMLSPRQLRNAQAGIEAFDHSMITLGSEDITEMFTTIPPQEDSSGAFGESRREPLGNLRPAKLFDRLQMMVADDVVQLRGIVDVDSDLTGLELIGDGIQGNAEEYGTDIQVIGTGTESVGLGDATVGTGRQGGGGAAQDIGLGLGSITIDDGAGYVGSRPLMIAGPHNRRYPIADRPADPSDAIALDHPGRDDGLGLGHDLTARGRDNPRDLFIEGRDRARMNNAAAQMVLANSNVLEESRIAANQTRQESALVLKELSGRLPEQRAQARLESAFARLDERRYSSALRDIQKGLRVIAKGHIEEGIPAIPAQVVLLVNYLVALRILDALQKMNQSPQAATMQGRLVATQLATALSELNLRADHRVLALALAVNGNLAIENYGTAAQLMGLIRDIGVPPELRPQLRAKYALCTARGFENLSPRPSTRLCWHTLLVIAPGTPELKCGLCPALFSAPSLIEDGLDLNGLCPCCMLGNLVRRHS